MWCNTCNIATSNEMCPICGELTIEKIPTEVYWCANCHVPIICSKACDEKSCPICRKNISYLASDIRPVFPEERLLVELLLEKKPNAYINSSIWVANNRYYIDGKTIVLPNKLLRKSSIQRIVDALDKFSYKNSYEFFNRNISLFIETNKTCLDAIVYEAHSFIRKIADKFQEENIVISFSGGKDSTVTADLVTNALSNPYLVHIFGNTTLELPQTIDYIKRYREDHLQAIFKVAENKEQNFQEVCNDIGPPARMMRWCCSMFKTGPITRVINSLYRNEQILTFYGIRQSESASRSKYNRIEDDPETVKIQQQTVASPIFFWNDIEIWLYLLTKEIDFNDAYRLGYDRVGCWCCPNNNDRAQFLNKIYLPEQSNSWRDYLISFAHHIGKPDAEEYIDSGKWKARQGGNGLAAAEDVKIQYINCTSEEHSKIYRLTRPMDDQFLNMFTPFGRVAPELGQKLLQEVIVVDLKSGMPIISVQPFYQGDYDFAVKVRTINTIDNQSLQKKIGYQVRKFNACRQCLRCESVCRAGAISISTNYYYIDPDKCTHCEKCVTTKYLRGGCLMDKYLRTKA